MPRASNAAAVNVVVALSVAPAVGAVSVTEGSMVSRLRYTKTPWPPGYCTKPREIQGWPTPVFVSPVFAGSRGNSVALTGLASLRRNTCCTAPSLVT